MKDVACVKPNTSLREVVIEMTSKPLGGAFVMEGNQFIGLITDGDVRRSLQACKSIEEVLAKDIMTENPIKRKTRKTFRMLSVLSPLIQSIRLSTR